jgi:hypothetical protein
MKLIVEVPSEAIKRKGIEEVQAWLREYTGDEELTMRVLPEEEIGVPANLLNCIAFAAWMEISDAGLGGMIKSSKKIQAPAGTVSYPVPKGSGGWDWVLLTRYQVENRHGNYQFRLGYSLPEKTYVLAEAE